MRPESTTTLPTYSITFTANGESRHVSMAGPDESFNTSCYSRISKIESALVQALPIRLADLVDIALAVYTADRLARRRVPSSSRYNLNWGRRLHVTLPVRDVEHWSDKCVVNQLVDVLSYLTEDDWRFTFEDFDDSSSDATQGYLFRNLPGSPITACLFSGGLDSLAGLCQDLTARPDGSCILISGKTSDRVGQIQRQTVGLLRHRLDRDLILIQVPFGLRRMGRSYNKDERTQRSRGFIMTALGAVTAILADADDLAIYENGIGAIGLPYTGAQLGAYNTRATHPITLAKMSGFLHRVTGHRLELRNPCILQTKAQLCGELASQGFGDLAQFTVSCDGFPQRVKGGVQCGLCTSCLLRRQALHAAGLETSYDSQRYRHDIRSLAGEQNDGRRYQFGAMHSQVVEIRRALDGENPWRDLSRSHPQLIEVAATLAPGAHSHKTVKESLVDLYRRYCNEWSDFVGQQATHIAVRHLEETDPDGC